MAGKSTKNIKFYISDADTTLVSLTPTAITKAKPAVVTVASTTGLVAGDIIKIPAGGTGFPELDGKLWVAGVVTGTTVGLFGSDTVGSAGVLAGTPSIKYAPAGTVTAITCALSEFTINTETPGTISAATFCDPSATIPATVVQAGTVNIVGHADIAEAGYIKLNSIQDDGLERILKVELPLANGFLIAPGIFNPIGWATPIDGTQGFTGSFTLSSRFKHRF